MMNHCTEHPKGKYGSKSEQMRHSMDQKETSARKLGLNDAF